MCEQRIDAVARALGRPARRRAMLAAVAAAMALPQAAGAGVGAPSPSQLGTHCMGDWDCEIGAVCERLRRGDSLGYCKPTGSRCHVVGQNCRSHDRCCGVLVCSLNGVCVHPDDDRYAW